MEGMRTPCLSLGMADDLFKALPDQRVLSFAEIDTGGGQGSTSTEGMRGPLRCVVSVGGCAMSCVAVAAWNL